MYKLILGGRERSEISFKYAVAAVFVAKDKIAILSPTKEVLFCSSTSKQV